MPVGREYDPGTLQRHADALLDASISARTRSVYDRHIGEYLSFAEQHPGLQRFGEGSLRLFVAKLHLEGLVHGTLLSYLSALKFHCRRFGFPNDLESPVVKGILKGARNMGLRDLPPRSQPCSVGEAVPDGQGDVLSI